MSQKQHWNNLHKRQVMEEYANKPTDFAKEIFDTFPAASKVLELGCGLGNDSVFFAGLGHSVIATDFSDVVIEQDKEKYKNQSNLTFQVLDMSEGIHFKDNEFDVVYARLSLHYFTDEVTKKIFKEINRILKPGGMLCFVCKSVEDPLYGKGEEIENDIYENDGHVRHFFSEKYARECLENIYQIEKLLKGEENFYGKKSAYVKVIARKVALERVDIVDKDCDVLYQATKLEAHKKGLLHKCVIAEIIDKDGKYMLIRPNSHKQDAGQYVSPVGGHVQAGETDEEALKREVAEEVGITDFTYNFVGKAIFDREVLGRHENHYFLLYEISSDNEPVLSDEAVSFDRFTKDELKVRLKENIKEFGDAYLFVIKIFYPNLLD